MDKSIDEMKAEIESLFDYGSYRDFTMELEKREDGWYLSVHQMYEYVTFNPGISTLQGMQKIAAILGCENGDEVERDCSGGCETCDWGSKYEIEWKFW